ncbi:DUF7554 family protein [Halobaculum magnesiiphilum]|uniref:Uncharacterized protein n=1 Tax=Halobaculum magnesiiphilum TaxID=1017351 RepID=A0A8T8W8Z2_9EURY|nr:hypothetical protein [Halobaculum magnesiiphilum]QZP36307.1 hypothetical protein K6T50_08120 [Halobaculum magnesiiphilum]
MALDVEDLLKIVLLLVIVWLVVEIVTGVLDFTIWLIAGPLKGLIGVVIVVLIVLWLTDNL